MPFLSHSPYICKSISGHGFFKPRCRHRQMNLNWHVKRRLQLKTIIQSGLVTYSMNIEINNMSREAILGEIQYLVFAGERQFLEILRSHNNVIALLY
jgi:hypothetical protein